MKNNTEIKNEGDTQSKPRHREIDILWVVSGNQRFLDNYYRNYFNLFCFFVKSIGQFS